MCRYESAADQPVMDDYMIAGYLGPLRSRRARVPTTHMGASGKVWRRLMADRGVADVDALPADPAVLKAALKAAKAAISVEKGHTPRVQERTIAKRFRQNAVES